MTSGLQSRNAEMTSVGILGVHREAQGASLSALPVGGLTWDCFMSSPLPLDVSKHAFFHAAHSAPLAQGTVLVGVSHNLLSDGGASGRGSYLGFASSLVEPDIGRREDVGNPWAESFCRELLAGDKRHDPRLCHSGPCDVDQYCAGVARTTPSASCGERRAPLQDNLRIADSSMPPCDSHPIRASTRRCWHREVSLTRARAYVQTNKLAITVLFWLKRCGSCQTMSFLQFGSHCRA